MRKIRKAYLALGIVTLLTGTHALAMEAAVQSNEEQQASVKVLNGKATITPPAGFKKMTVGEIGQAYAKVSPKPRDVLYKQTESGQVSILFFSPFPDKPLKDEHVPRLAEVMKKQMAKDKPELTTKELNGHTVSRIESVLNDPSGKYYVVRQISSLDNRLLMVALQVPVSFKDKYLSQCMTSLDTLAY